MKQTDHRDHHPPDLGAPIARGCSLLLGAVAVALILAATSASREHEAGAAHAHGPPTASTRTHSMLTMLWDASGRNYTAAATWDIDENGDDELLVLQDDDVVVIFDADGAPQRSVLLRQTARSLDVAKQRNPPAMILGSRRYGQRSVAAYDRAGDDVWYYPLPRGYDVAACAVADIDGDGVEETIAAQSDMGLSCLDADGRLRWELPLPGLIASLAVGDIDGDGRPEILVAGHDTPVTVVSWQGHALRTWDIWASACYIAAADLDGDGRAEIAVKTATFREPENAFVAGVDSSGQFIWRRPVPGLVRAVARPLTAVDINGDGVREWAAVGSDGSVHLIGKNGEPLGRQNVGEPVIGVYPMRTRAGAAEWLVAVSPTSAKCLQFRGGAGR